MTRALEVGPVAVREIRIDLSEPEQPVLFARLEGHMHGWRQVSVRETGFPVYEAVHMIMMKPEILADAEVVNPQVVDGVAPAEACVIARSDFVRLAALRDSVAMRPPCGATALRLSALMAAFFVRPDGEL
jgi:hypothetical protein